MLSFMARLNELNSDSMIKQMTAVPMYNFFDIN